MLPFFNKKNKKSDQGERPVEAKASEQEFVSTTLSFHPHWQIPEEEKYVYAFRNNEARPLQKNQTSITTVDMEKKQENYHFTVLMRHTFNRDFSFPKQEVLLFDEGFHVMGRKLVDFRKLGVLPPRTTRPWEIVFTPDDLRDAYVEPKANWNLAFEQKRANRLDLDDNWKKALARESIQELEQLAASAPALKPGEINFISLEAKKGADNTMVVSLLMRNGKDRDIEFKKLPMRVYDASGEVAAEGGFAFDSLKVKSNTSKPWTFVFPASLLKKDIEEIDLTKWRVEIVQ